MLLICVNRAAPSLSATSAPLIHLRGRFGRPAEELHTGTGKPVYLPPELEDDLTSLDVLSAGFRLGSFYQP